MAEHSRVAAAQAANASPPESPPGGNSGLVNQQRLSSPDEDSRHPRSHSAPIPTVDFPFTNGTTPAGAQGQRGGHGRGDAQQSTPSNTGGRGTVQERRFIRGQQGRSTRGRQGPGSEALSPVAPEFVPLSLSLAATQQGPDSGGKFKSSSRNLSTVTERNLSLISKYPAS